MKVTLNTTVLADHNGESNVTGVSGFKINGTRKVQIAEFFRGAHAKPRDRKNLKHSVSFRVTRLFESAAEAEQFLIKHAGDIAASGTVEIESRSPVGTVSRVWLTNAVVEDIESSYAGASTFHTYKILGGALTLTQPTT